MLASTVTLLSAGRLKCRLEAVFSGTRRRVLRPSNADVQEMISRGMEVRDP